MSRCYVRWTGTGGNESASARTCEDLPEAFRRLRTSSRARAAGGGGGALALSSPHTLSSLCLRGLRADWPAKAEPGIAEPSLVPCAAGSRAAPHAHKPTLPASIFSARALVRTRAVLCTDDCGELVGGGAGCCAGKGGTRCAHAWDRGCVRGSSCRVNWTVAARACPCSTPPIGTLVSIAALQPDPGSLQGRQRLGRVRHSVPESRLSGREVLGQESPPGGSAGRGRGAASRPRRTGKAPLRGKPLAHG